MSRARKTLGESGEALAVEHLTKLGYRIIEKNFRSRLGEIDIIAKQKNTICFIEVKTRSDLKKGYPQEAITKRKQHHLTRVALGYLKENGLMDKSARFDVVSILKREDATPAIDIIKNAFYLDSHYIY
ncbi:YraN family protein [Candidatus Omnitrophota bacterium]